MFLLPGYLAVAHEYADSSFLGALLQQPEHSGGMQEAIARALVQQMAVALSFCHGRGVTLGGFGLNSWLLDRAPLLRRQMSGGNS